MKGLRGLFFLGLFIACTALFREFFKQLRASKQVYPIFDPLCSGAMQQEVNKYLNTLILSDVPTFCSRLKQQWPIINDVTFCQKNNNCCFVYIKLLPPLYQINNDYLMLTSGIISQKKYFEPQSILPLYTITTSSSRQMDLQRITHWLEQSTQHLFEKFNVHVINPTEIVLTEKQTQQFMLCCHYAQILTDDLYNRCLALKNSLTNIQTKNNKQIWIADLRFEKQFILYKRGNNEGKNIF